MTPPWVTALLDVMEKPWRPDSARLLADSATVLHDLLLEIGANPHAPGVALPGDTYFELAGSVPPHRLPLVERLRTWICRHDLAMLDPRAAVVVAQLGDCAPRSTTEAKWHRRVLAAVARGEYPSGRAIRGRHCASGSLGSREQACRSLVLTELGWVQLFPGKMTARWVPPEGSEQWQWTPGRRRAIARHLRG